MLRKYGILARPIAYHLNFARKIILCCANLHNRSVNKWLRKGGILDPPKQSSDVLCFNAVHDLERNIDTSFDINANDGDICDYMNNLTEEEVPKDLPVQSQKKEILLNHIYNSGIRFDLRADMDFTYPVDI